MSSLKAEDILGIGSSRVAIDLHDGRVAKIAFCEHGKDANAEELERYTNLADKSLVAKTEYVNDSVILQEKLTDCVTLPWRIKDEDVPEHLKHLNAIRLGNRLQAGKDSQGNWKIYDFEEAKCFDRSKIRKAPTVEEILAEMEVNEQWQI